MSARYSQSKAETQRHAEILKNMLKKPENKLCADCKRNDPRWASTNLGCFMCIRCSGIHRGMGVHITRVKSVDLDTWSPEQIATIQRWGNRRANAYWEAHLKAGHSPPEHKMESFIRSKYEMRRWAMEGPVPEPETLDADGDSHAYAATTTENNGAPPTRATSSRSSASTTATATRKAAPTTSIDLLAEPPSTNSATRPTPRSSAPAPVPATKPSSSSNSGGGGLFDLDFNAPAQAPAAPAPKRDAKADILSLFASAPPPRPVQPVQTQTQHSHQSQPSFGVSSATAGLSGLNLGGGGGGGAGVSMSSDLWGPPAASSSGPGGFDAFESFTSSAPAPAAVSRQAPFSAAPADVWGGSSASNPWGGPAAAATNGNDSFGDFTGGFTSSSGTATSQPAKKPSDAFSDIWA